MTKLKARSPQVVAAAAAGPAEESFWQRWQSFWFTPADPVGLHALRLLSGLLFLLWLLTLAGEQQALFGLTGWFDIQAYRDISRLPGGPPAPFGWSILYLCGTNAVLLNIVYGCSLGVLLLFTLGVWTRLTAVLTWIIVVSFLANPVTSYGADHLLVVLAFYLMIGYLLQGQWGRPLTPLQRVLGTGDTFLLGRWRNRDGRQTQPVRSYAANLAVRLLQVHLALAIVVSALHKLQFGDWWTGVALWYPLHPPMQTTFADIRTEVNVAWSYLFFLSLVQYTVLGWQLTFPLFAWRAQWFWRGVLLIGGVLGWLGCLLVFGWPLYGPIVLLACLSYLTPAEWRGLLARLPRGAAPQRKEPAPALNTTAKATV